MTNLKLEVTSELGLQSTGNEDTLLTIWLNRAVRDVLRRTSCYVTSTTITESSGTGDYGLTAAILAVKAWRWTSATDSTDIVPERVSLQDIERLRSLDTDTSSDPAQFFAVTGTTLSIWPTPSAADTITVWYVPKPTEMSSGSHDTTSATYGGIPEEFTEAIVLYALWKAASYRDDQSSDQGERYRKQYQDLVKEFQRSVIKRGGKLPRARVRPTTRLLPRDPAVSNAFRF